MIVVFASTCDTRNLQELPTPRVIHNLSTGLWGVDNLLIGVWAYRSVSGRGIHFPHKI